jgi:hypothetical protein
MYPDYLVHFNKNHSPKNGQFTSGDGDGDGISNDHAHRSKKDGGRKPITRSQAKAMNTVSKKSIKGGSIMLGVGSGLGFVSRVSSMIANQTDSYVASGIAAATAAAAIPLTAIGTTRVVTGVVKNIKSNNILRQDE